MQCVLFFFSKQGLPVVRAFRAEGRFFKTCCDRINDMNRCHIYLWIANRWLAFRMQLLGAIVAGSVGLAGTHFYDLTWCAQVIIKILFYYL